MADYFLDPAVFGNVNAGLSQSQQDQFRPLTPNDVGSGHYRQFNPTGPIPLQASWDWTAAQFAQFRADWDDISALRFGVAWFDMILPLGLFPMGYDNALGMSDAVSTHQLTVGVYDTNPNVVGFDQATAVGSLTPATVGSYPQAITYLRTTTAGDRLLLNFDAGTQLENNTDSLTLILPGLPDTPMPWVASGLWYRNTTSTTTLFNWLNDRLGETVPIGIRYKAPADARCRAHFTAPYSATPLGPENWRISATLEVDMSPALEGMT